MQDEEDPAQRLQAGTRGLPSTTYGAGSGSNGSFDDHSSSDTIHGRDARFAMREPTSNEADSHMINSIW
ncbi:hypothetical protein ACIOKD_30900 [Streptomyces sp. NPDC087844]|uniref:hypothetical protein n=1 Tax=Streptomyces sp. NPDC087844 TaxID=3365805 RepID=UPI0037FCF80F